MADWTDDASKTTEFFEQLALKQVRNTPVLTPRGSCHYCEAPLVSTVFCDQDCRDDWEAEQAARKRNGK